MEMDIPASNGVVQVLQSVVQQWVWTLTIGRTKKQSTNIMTASIIYALSLNKYILSSTYINLIQISMPMPVSCLVLYFIT